MSNSNNSIGLQLLKPVTRRHLHAHQETVNALAQFGRKLVMGTRRKWQETEMRQRRLPPETETLTILLETRPRRDVGTSRDRDHNPDLGRPTLVADLMV